MWNISQKSFLSIHFGSISRETEDAVDRLSSGFDAVARSLASLVEAKRAFMRGLTQQLLTGRKRFPECERSSVRQLGEVGTVPADWTVFQIGDIARQISTRGASNAAVVYSCSKHDGLVPSLEYFGRQVFSRDLAGYKCLEVGDFVYATNHIEEGSIGLLRNGQSPGVASPMYTVFRPAEQVNPEFLFALLKTESYRRVFASRTNASVNRRGSLRWKEFSRIKVGLPSREEQDRIAKTLRLLDLEIGQLATLSQLVEVQRRVLVDRLISGSIPAPA